MKKRDGLNVGKRALTLFIATVIITTILQTGTYAAGQVTLPLSGSCGNNTGFTYDIETGKLDISPISGSEPAGIKDFAFSLYYDDKTKVKNVVIHEGINAIGLAAFQNCNDMISITLPESLEVIGDYAFNSCISLKEMCIPNNVCQIGKGAFYSTKIADYSVSENNQHFIYEDGVLMTAEKSEVVKFTSVANTTCILPQGTKLIREGAGGGDCKAQYIVLPEGLEEIERSSIPTATTRMLVPRSLTKLHVFFSSGGTTKCRLYFPENNIDDLEVTGGELQNYTLGFNPISLSGFENIDDNDIKVTFTYLQYNEICETKWALGKQDLSFFSANGELFVENNITIPQNETVTIYCKDIAGIESANAFNLSGFTAPVASKMSVGEKLLNSTLIGGTTEFKGESGEWRWEQIFLIPKVGTNTYNVVFKSDSYRITVPISVTVHKRNLEIDMTKIKASDITYGQTLRNSVIDIKP